MRLDGKIAILLEEEAFAFCQKNDTSAVIASTSGTPYPVHILLAVRWNSNLDHKVNIRKVHASANHV